MYQKPCESLRVLACHEHLLNVPFGLHKYGSSFENADISSKAPPSEIMISDSRHIADVAMREDTGHDSDNVSVESLVDGHFHCGVAEDGANG